MVENRLRIAHAAIGETSDRDQRGRFNFDVLGLANLHELLDDNGIQNWTKLKALTTRHYGRQYLVCLGRCEKEFYMLGWLFERLKECIKRRR